VGTAGHPSAHLCAHLERIRAALHLGPVVDVACGRGRHTLALAEHAIPVLGIDRNAAHLTELMRSARARSLPVALLRADLEIGDELPLLPERCGAVLVFRYLHRPLLPGLVRALRPGGLLLYETFTMHQKEFGYGPVNPDFLLAAGELTEQFRALRVIESWEGVDTGSPPAAVARIAAIKP
jgi:tellurite methyltransferase